MAKLKQFVWNGILITLGSLLIRTVSVSFNVYLSNRVGAVAMGLFTLISTVYGFAITVANLTTIPILYPYIILPSPSDARSLTKELAKAHHFHRYKYTKLYLYMVSLFA